MLVPHVIVIVCGTNMWSAHGFVYINNEMLIICILPFRVKEQPELKQIFKDGIPKFHGIPTYLNFCEDIICLYFVCTVSDIRVWLQTTTSSHSRGNCLVL